MYKLNNIPLINFGIHPGRINGSNIALSGMLDMPARIGKTFHDWSGEAGVEPYVLPAEIMHGGRTIHFAGLLKGVDRTGAATMARNFYREISAFNGLVELVTPWSTHQVHIKERIEGKYLQGGWNQIAIDFEEPVVPNDGVLPVGAVTDRPHIDGVALDSFGMFLSRSEGVLNRPQTKDPNFTAYEKQGYQITPPAALEFDLQLIAYADSFALLKDNIKKLQRLLSAAGLRQINFDGNLWEVFNVKGFQVKDLKVAANYAVCRIDLPLLCRTTGEPLNVVPLYVNEYDNLLSNLNDLIKVNNNG